MGDFLASDVAVWCTSFWCNERQIQLKDFVDGIFLNRVFCEIADYDWTSVEPLLSNATVNNCFQNWKLLIKNLEDFFIDKLHQLIITAPPSIFHIVYSPSSVTAKIELRRATLLLLFAAINCEKRERYIRSIMENLSTDVQNGIMQSITGFTECPDSALNLAGTCELTRELRHGLVKALVNRIDLHFQLAEEVIHRVSNHHRECTPKKGDLSTIQQEQQLNRKIPPNLTRSRSLASSLELIGCAFRRTIEERELIHNQPMSGDADTLTNSETGYESRPLTDEALKDRSELLESRDLDALLVVLETQSFIDNDEKKHIVAQIDKTKAKLRQQALLISEQADQLEEMHMQLLEARSEADQLRVERTRLADAATAARHWQDEADAGQLAIAQLRDSERTCEELKLRLEAAQYYKVRCQELSAEVDGLVKARNDLESRLSEQQERQAKAQLLDEKLTEKSKQLLDLEWQREKDLEEICRLKNELMEARIDTYNVSRKQLSLRCPSPIHSDCEENNIICPAAQLEYPLSVREHLHLDKLSPAHGASEKALVEKQEELELAVARCASHLREIRARLDASRGKASSDLSSPNPSQFSDTVSSSIGERVDAFMEDLEQVIRDVIGTVKENDLKVSALARANFSKPITFQVAAQTDPLQHQEDEKTLAQSSAFLKKIMQSAQSTFQDSVESLRNMMTDAMVWELQGNLNSTKDLNRRPVPQSETQCQTSPELHTTTNSGGIQRSYRICNQFGTPLQLGIVQPNRLQRSVAICSGVRDARTKAFSHKAVNTTPIVDVSHVSASEAVHEALLRATDAKKLLATVRRENDEARDRAEATKHELDHCKAFLEEYEKRNAYLEKENRAVLLQLRSLLSQNQGVIMEALESSECHYREKLALHDEVAVLKRHKELLEERIMEQCRRLPSPKKVKPGLGILQKAREALMKNKGAYTLGNGRLSLKNTYISDIEQVPLRLQVEKEKFGNGYPEHFHNFSDSPERKQWGVKYSNPSALSKSKPTWGYPSGDSTPMPRRYLSEYQIRNTNDVLSTGGSLLLKSSSRFPVTDRREDDCVEVRSSSSVVSPAGRAAATERDQPTALDPRPLESPRSAFARRRRVSSTNENSQTPSLGGLIGRSKGSFSEVAHTSPVSSSPGPHSGTLGRRLGGDPATASANLTNSAPPASSITGPPECLAKPVVFLEYGDL